MEREENHKLPFLDVLLDNHSNQSIINSVFHKKTYTGLLTNYYRFVPFSYNLGLVRTLVDQVFKINNTWAGFDLDINSLTTTLRKNLFPSSVIENVVRKFLNNYFTSDSSIIIIIITGMLFTETQVPLFFQVNFRNVIWPFHSFKCGLLNNLTLPTFHSTYTASVVAFQINLFQISTLY